MNKVEPIRDKNKIKEIKNILKKKSYRNYMLFVLGINTGLRIGDRSKSMLVNLVGLPRGGSIVKLKS